MVFTTAELTWLTFLLRDIGVSLLKPSQLFCDNVSALHMSINPMFHARTKHVELDYHFVREKAAMGTLVTRFISYASQPADVLTKSLSKDAFVFFWAKLGIHPSYYASLRGHVKENTNTIKKINSHNLEDQENHSHDSCK